MSAQETVSLRETWDTDTSGWTERDAGSPFVVGWDTEPPVQGGGYLLGEYPTQALPYPDTDAFLATTNASGGRFVGDLLAYGFALDDLRMDLTPEGDLPSLILLRLDEAGGARHLFRDITGLVTNTTGRNRISIPLQYDAQWLGDDATGFTNVLQNLGNLQVQITRGDDLAQALRIDNLVLSMTVDAGTAGLDTDLDGMPDYWETLFSGNPTNLVATSDGDLDGLDALGEYIAGTDPTQSGSFPHIQTLTGNAGQLLVHFDTVADRSYMLETNDQFPINTWLQVGSLISGNDTFQTLPYLSPSNGLQVLRLNISRP